MSSQTQSRCFRLKPLEVWEQEPGVNSQWDSGKHKVTSALDTLVVLGKRLHQELQVHTFSRLLSMECRGRCEPPAGTLGEYLGGISKLPSMEVCPQEVLLKNVRECLQQGSGVGKGTV